MNPFTKRMSNIYKNLIIYLFLDERGERVLSDVAVVSTPISPAGQVVAEKMIELATA